MLLDKVVIGSTLEAAYYALINDTHFISNRNCPPMFYRENTETWPKLNFMLGLLAKRLCFEEIETIRIVDNQLKVSALNRTYKYGFSECHIFDPTGIQFDNAIITPAEKSYVVLDDFELSVLGTPREQIEPSRSCGALAREMHFYCSDRVDGANYITDCVVESELSKEQLNSFDYSDTVTRFLVERHLESVGVKGRFMRNYKSGKPKYRKPKVVHVKRLVFERDNNTYEDSEFVKFKNMSLQEIVFEASAKR